MPRLQRQLRLPIPTHIITGLLGSGKTTAISQLLRAKPAEEQWALIINEAGPVGIDAALLSAPASQGVAVKELAGGCMCCVLSGVTSVAIAKLIREVKPDRVLIEPSGLGHPAALIEILRGQYLQSALALQPIVCLVDTSRFSVLNATDTLEESLGQLFRDQVSIAQVLIGSKADLADVGTLERFQAWAESLFPPKELIATCSQGQLQPAWLVIQPDRSTAQPTTTAGSPPHSLNVSAGPYRSGGSWLTNSAATESAAIDTGLSPRQPVCKVAEQQSGCMACGWIFHVEDTFTVDKLQALLQGLAANPAVLRLKGVFRVSTKVWVAVNHVAAASKPIELKDIAYRGGSRVELIVNVPASSSGASSPAATGLDWDVLEHQLKQCLQP